MTRTSTLAAIGSLLVLLAPAADANDLLSPSEAQRIGMVESWHRQIGTIGGARSIIDIQLWTQSDTQREYVEVFLAGDAGQEQVLERIPTDLKDNDGAAIGKAEAERMAKMSVLRLKRRSLDAQTRVINIQQVRLYVLSSDGSLAAYDAETGEQLWAVRLGNPALGYGTLGIDDHYVTVLNGTSMIQVIASDTQPEDGEAGSQHVMRGGRPLPPTRLDGVPLFGATHSNGYAVIPITRNGIETYRLDGSSIQPGFEMFSGQALSKPATFPRSNRLMWPTDQQFVYAMETDGTPSLLFRLATQGLVQGGVSAASDLRFFFGSTDGRVYGVRATRTGEVLWNQSLGEPFYTAPFLSGDSLLINSGYGNLHKLNMQTGEPLWQQPSRGIDQVFAHAGNQFVARDRDHQLVLIDEQTGRLTHTLPNVFVQYVIINQETDRFYLASQGGMLQCLRPVDSELPVFRRDVAVAPGDAAEPAAAESAAAEPESGQPQPPKDPFGAGEAKPADPFGGDPFGGGAPGSDPFGGADAGADPFGGADAGADPFGGAADPF